MKKIHLIVGDFAAQSLSGACRHDDHLNGEVIVLKDLLSLGPIYKEGQTFSEVRNEFWNKVYGGEKQQIVFDDLDKLMDVSTQLSNDQDLALWFWMAPSPADVSAYFWLLHYMQKHLGRIFVVNINGLPFLDDNRQLFYPKGFGQLPIKEIIKAQKLARCITSSEWEIDGSEWKRLTGENSGVRILEGNKKLSGQNIDFYDQDLWALCTHQNQKASKIANLAYSKKGIITGDLFILWRLKEMHLAGKVIYEKGDVKLSNLVET